MKCRTEVTACSTRAQDTVQYIYYNTHNINERKIVFRSDDPWYRVQAVGKKLRKLQRRTKYFIE
jgi:hypothetical protein